MPAKSRGVNEIFQKRKWGQNAKVLLVLKTLAGARLSKNSCETADRSGWCIRHGAADWQFLLGFDHSDGSTFYSTPLVAPGTATEDVWQHVVAVCTPSLVSIYVNGVLAASQAPSMPLLPNFAAPLILGDRGYTGWGFIGDLDEVAIYTNELSAAETLQHYNVSNDLVLHLKFDGNYQDSSGRNNNGTNVGATAIVAGKFGTGALHYTTVLDGGGGIMEANYVSLGTPTDLAIGSGQNFSTTFWIKFTGNPGDLPFLGNTINSYGDPGIDFAPSWQQGSWSWYINDQAAAAWAGLGLYSPVQDNLNDGQWHHLVHVFDRPYEAVTYLDGVKVNTTIISTGAMWDFSTANEWEIGQAGGGAYAVAGDFQMDDLGFWHRALTEYEAQGIYLGGGQYGRSFDTSALPSVTLTITRNGSNLDISWTSGALLQSTNATGTYVAVPGATPPLYHASPTNSATFFRVQQ